MSQGKNPSSTKGDGKGKDNNSFGTGLTPAQALVIGGILGGVLFVDSLLIGRDQHIEIVLTGSLKPGANVDETLSQIGQIPLEQVIKLFADKSQ